MNAVTKGLEQFLEEDPSLRESISYTEFENKKAAPNNSDKKLAVVYQTYCDVVEKLENLESKIQ